jgi:hypothetical protein
MLGRKTPGGLESLSQGTFVRDLIPHISQNPDEDFDRMRRGESPIRDDKLVFNGYFCDDKDHNILKVLLNLFTAVKDTWPKEWAAPSEYVLSKTTGYSGIMRVLPELVEYGKVRRELSYEFFLKVFSAARELMRQENIEITSENFVSSARGEVQFRDILIRALDRLKIG